MTTAQILTFLGSSLQLYAFIPYGIAMMRHQIKPHVFTWFIWGLLAGISFAAQISAGGGLGAWVTFASASGCIVITLLALRYGTRNITRGDWLAFAIALATIPLWLVTNNPLWSVLVVLCINLVGFWPTLRKSWFAPHQEHAMVFFIGGIASILSLCAMQDKNLVTMLYPGWLAFSNMTFVALLVLRRRNVNK